MNEEIMINSSYSRVYNEKFKLLVNEIDLEEKKILLKKKETNKAYFYI